MIEIERGVKTPKSKLVLLPLITTLTFLNLVLVYNYWTSVGVAVGLWIDIIGASILAIPDIPNIWIYTYSGRLNYAKETLDRTGRGGFSTLCRSEDSPTGRETNTGFLELLEVISPVDQSILGSHTHSVYFVKDDVDADEIARIEMGSSQDPSMFENLPDTETTGYKGWKSGIATPATAAFFYPKNLIDKSVNSQIKKYRARIRRLGLSLLIIGFLQQFISMLLTNYL